MNRPVANFQDAATTSKISPRWSWMTSLVSLRKIAVVESAAVGATSDFIAPIRTWASPIWVPVIAKFFNEKDWFWSFSSGVHTTGSYYSRTPYCLFPNLHALNFMSRPYPPSNLWGVKYCKEYDYPGCITSCQDPQCGSPGAEVGIAFWTDRCSATRNAARAETLQKAFGGSKVPSFYATNPRCDHYSPMCNWGKLCVRWWFFCMWT